LAQNYSNHVQRVGGYLALAGVLLLTLIGSLVNLFRSFGDHARLYNAALIVVLTGCVVVTAFYARIFALRAQDRAIRAEENLRHFVMTGKPLDPRLSIRQIIGLRFASDSEFLELERRAVDENLTEDAIKRAVKNWHPDFDRA
jgi:hypothetical protein